MLDHLLSVGCLLELEALDNHQMVGEWSFFCKKTK